MIQFNNVCKTYANGHQALKNISFTLHKGDMAFILGNSGAGKSTIFRLISQIEKPSSGDIIVLDQNVNTLLKQHIPFLRREIGVVFQDHKLLNNKTVFDNVALPLIVIGMQPKEIKKRVRAALLKVGLEEHENSFPLSLSGGEQQRVGIARAVINRPSILLADEPTGNVDQKMADEIMDIFTLFNQVGVTVLIATHDLRQVERLEKKVLQIENGSLVTHSE